MPSPQAVVTFAAVLFVMLVALHVPLALPAIPAAVASLVLAIGAAWIVNRRVPDDDEDVTEDARNTVAKAESDATGNDDETTVSADPGDAEPKSAERGATSDY